MRLQKVSTKFRIVLVLVGRMVLVLIALLAAVLLGDHLIRCYGKPLGREEALRRANAQLQFYHRTHELGDTLPALVEERYDREEKEWTFRFRSSTCTVDIIADRCHGTEIGGLSEGCRPR
jgi:hypothetical protein